MHEARLVNVRTKSAQKVLASTFNPAILDDDQFYLSCGDDLCPARVSFHSATRVEGLARGRDAHFATMPGEAHRFRCTTPASLQDIKKRLSVVQAIEAGLPVVVNLNIPALSDKGNRISKRRTQAALKQRLRRDGWADAGYATISVHSAKELTQLTARVRDHRERTGSPSPVYVAYKASVRLLKELHLDASQAQLRSVIGGLMRRTAKPEGRDESLQYSAYLPMMVTMAFNDVTRALPEVMPDKITTVFTRNAKAQGGDIFQRDWQSPVLPVNEGSRFYPYFLGRRRHAPFPWDAVRFSIRSDNADINAVLIAYAAAGEAARLIVTLPETDIRRTLHKAGRHQPGGVLDIPLAVISASQIVPYKKPRAQATSMLKAS